MSTDPKVLEAAHAFGAPDPDDVQEISGGLIHQTYKVQSRDRVIVLQQINTSVFQHPHHIVENHARLFEHLQRKSVILAEPLRTSRGEWLWKDEDVWRAQSYIPNTFTEKGNLTEERAFQTAHCFASFTQALADFDGTRLHEPLPHFHDLAWRFEQFETALSSAAANRKQQAAALIRQLYEYQSLVKLFQHVTSFQKHMVHHDAKLSNVLFDQRTQQTVCPIDLDTTMYGYFFSDLGDMIRSMTVTADENSTAWNALEIDVKLYRALVDGYLTGFKNASADERRYFHYAGMLMLYMQALRFLTDYLNNDTYYKIKYPDQNFDRGKNQLLALQQLEKFLRLSALISA